ncbi:MAG TPA: hypothetical protein VNQ90_08805 [Chthoniobacteraceae bacterium]|nr:hypothetical protein [Chthoniobacteraceae bacterium]
MIAKPLRPLLLLAAMAFSAAHSLTAANSFHDRFDTLDSNVWETGNSVTYPSDFLRTQNISGTNYLNFRRNIDGETSTGTGSTFLYYKGTPDFVPGGQIADFTLDVVIRISQTGNSDSAGVAFRMSSTDYSSTAKTGYYLGIDKYRTTSSGSDGTPYLKLYKNPNGSAVSTDALSNTPPKDRVTLLASDPLVGGLDLDTDYTLRLRVEGSVIEASLYKPGVDDPIASLSINNAEYLNAGFLGLRTHNTNYGTSVYYRDFNVAAIPEPSTAALAGLMLGGMLLMKLRSRR